MQFRSFDDYTIERPRYMQSGRIHIMFRGKEYSGDLSAGGNDYIEVFRAVGDPNTYYVYSENSGLPYVGLQVMERTSKGMKTVGEVFFQESQVEDALGRSWEDRTALTNAKKMSEYTYNNNPAQRKNKKPSKGKSKAQRKAQSNAKKAMKMSNDRGISLKQAWKIVKRGK